MEDVSLLQRSHDFGRRQTMMAWSEYPAAILVDGFVVFAVPAMWGKALTAIRRIGGRLSA